MQNDSIETLLLRHYGSAAPTPVGLEQRLLASVHQEANALHYQSASASAPLFARRISRRRAVGLVAIGSAGLGLLSVGMEMVEATLVGTDSRQPAYS